MSDAEGLGHNSGVLTLLDEHDKLARLTLDFQALPDVLDAQSAEVARDLKKAAQDFAAICEKTRMIKQKPFTDAVERVRASFRPLVDKAEDIKALVQRRLNVFAIAEDARLKAIAAKAQEEALERAREAALAAEAAEDPFEADDAAAAEKAAAEAQLAATHASKAAANGPRIASATGITRAAGLRSTWGVEVKDAKALVIHLANHPSVQAEAIKVANALARAAKGALDLPGCKPVEIKSAI